MITAEQAWANAKPLLEQKQIEQNVLEGRQFREWLTQIEEASKAGETYITLVDIKPWQYKEFKRLGFRVTNFNGKDYICWEVYDKLPVPTKLTWWDKLKIIFGD